MDPAYLRQPNAKHITHMWLGVPGCRPPPRDDMGLMKCPPPEEYGKAGGVLRQSAAQHGKVRGHGAVGPMGPMGPMG